MTVEEIREGEKRGPWVDWDMILLPVLTAGDCHMMFDLLWYVVGI